MIDPNFSQHIVVIENLVKSSHFVWPKMISEWLYYPRKQKNDFSIVKKVSEIPNFLQINNVFYSFFP